MADYPTAIYPIAPKPEWFFRKPNNFHSNTVQASNAGAGGHPNPDYVQMDLTTYKFYLSAHDEWRERVAKVAKSEHENALIRRIYESRTETFVGFKSPGGPDPDKDIVKTIPIDIDEDVTVKAQFAIKRKVAHEPKLSTKPHRAEKRQEKKKLADQRTKVAVEVTKAKNAALVETMDKRTSIVREAEDSRLTVNRNKVDSATAKSVGALVNVVKKASPDNVANIEHDESVGWKFVSRKKGNFMPVVAEIGETVVDGKSIWQVSKDPVASVALLPKNAVRRPNEVSK